MSITKISPSVVDFDAGITISTTDNSDNLTLTSTDADASVGPAINLYRNSSSPADNDFLGNIKFNGRNDNTQDVQYAEVEAYILDASDGTEDGLYNINVMTAGTNRTYMQISGTSGVVFNEDSNDIDFRVEGDGNTHALFVISSDDKVGIGVSDPGGLPLHLKVASGDNKLRQETAAKDAFTLGLDNSTGDTIIGTHTLYPAVRFLNAGGIAFGSDTAAANALNDYEEGTWTAQLSGCDSVNATGNYVKVGDLVFASVYSGAFTVANASGTASVTNLPFTAKSGYYGGVSCVHYNGFAAGEVEAYVNAGTSAITFIDQGSVSTTTWVNGFPKYYMVMATYQAA